MTKKIQTPKPNDIIRVVYWDNSTTRQELYATISNEPWFIVSYGRFLGETEEIWFVESEFCYEEYDSKGLLSEHTMTTHKIVKKCIVDVKIMGKEKFGLPSKVGTKITIVQ